MTEFATLGLLLGNTSDVPPQVGLYILGTVTNSYKSCVAFTSVNALERGDASENIGKLIVFLNQVRYCHLLDYKK